MVVEDVEVTLNDVDSEREVVLDVVGVEVVDPVVLVLLDMVIDCDTVVELDTEELIVKELDDDTEGVIDNEADEVEVRDTLVLCDVLPDNDMD